jgi:hypothetical protein
MEWLTLTRELRPCRRCHAPTLWTIGRAGVCLDHALGYRTRERALTLPELLRALPVDSVVEATESHAEPRTAGAWRWVATGVRWRSHTERKDRT